MLLCVCFGGPPKHSGFITFHESIISYRLLLSLGWRKSPILVHVILFSVFAQVQKAVDVFLLFCFILTEIL